MTDLIKKRIEKLNKFFIKNEDGLIEIDVSKDREIKGKEGLYKVKLILDFPKRSLVVVRGVGKNLMQAVNNSFKKLLRQLRRKP
ncbi:MAG: hypothetical protein KatS3mg093_176 [Candidatus Parcubacteria bacterium]|nr:MAG: hypothetical protein KatS3mg093_176 [Candidatus Parcubacteria bacterium]